MGRLKFRSYESVQDIRTLESSWRRLHEDCTHPSIYNGFDFFISSTTAFTDPDIRLYVLVASEGSEVVAIFPFQLSHLRREGTRLELLGYAAQWEIDKPYPLIRDGYERIAWTELVHFLAANRRRWHRFDLMEVRKDLTAATLLPKLLSKRGYFVRVREDRETPLINLNRPWEERWRAHQKMRKKVSRMQNTFGNRLRFQVLEGLDTWESCLATYMELESKGWKAGRVGIGKNSQTTAFYREFFSRIAANGALRFGMLYVDSEVVAAEIAYIYKQTVYFAHGTYDERFSKYSPGMVSTSLFLRYFHESGFQDGDYLAGYTGYLIPWADRIVPSYKITGIRFSPFVFISLVTEYARKILKPSKPLTHDDPSHPRGPIPAERLH